MIRVELPYPAKALWPNKRPHHMAKAKGAKKHRAWADIAALEAIQIAKMSTSMSEYYGGSVDAAAGSLRVNIVVFPLRTGPTPDRDNCVAAAKAYLDGIAQRLRINDRMFAAPTVEFAQIRNGRFVIEIGGAPA